MSELASTSLRFAAACVVSLGIVGQLFADQAPAFPSDANSWINSGPLSVAGLKGKGIVLWFFEEDDANIKMRWPDVLDAAKQYERQAVVFIAVNSGSPRAKMDGYVRQHQIPWPVIIDASRQFEKACGLVQEINAQNTSIFRYITPDGEIHNSVTDDVGDAAEKAAEGAEWKLDPTGIPDSLKATWWAVETGHLKGIAASLKKSSASSKADVKEAATKLSEVIQKEIDSLVEKIKESQTDNPYKAFELVTDLTEHYVGFDVPKDITSLKKELTKDAKVKAGQTALKHLEASRKTLSGNNASAKTKTLASLEKIVADFPDTSLAQQAQALIDNAK